MTGAFMHDCIPKDALVHNGIYSGHCRNSDEARWDESRDCFVYQRCKFGETYEDTCKHPEDDDGYDLFYPEELLRVDRSI